MLRAVSKILTWFHRLDIWLDKHTIVLALLVLLVLLRIPNFFEPYWYGDEGIYLTIGNALRDGAVLYQDIIDHKTPIIYYLAMVPSQLWFRTLLLGWMAVSTILFVDILKKILPNSRWLTILCGSIFVVTTSWPSLEGNIPNGELFMMGFVLASLRLALAKKWLFAGIFGALAVLVKVPAIFDIAAVGLLLWWQLLTSNWQDYYKKPAQFFQKYLKPGLLFMLGIAGPIFLSVLYFIFRGAGAEYLQYGLLYNFYYIGSWTPELAISNLSFLATLPGKISFLALWVVLISIIGKWLGKYSSFTLAWLGFAVVASTLSNRPYPHYFLQVIPAATLVLGFFVSGLASFLTEPKRSDLLQISATVLGIGLVSFSWILFSFWQYPGIEYYTKFGAFFTGQSTAAEYYHSFDKLTDTNLKVASYLRTAEAKQIFIWGTNPMLYAQSQTYPVGPFTVSFHITDLEYWQPTIQHLSSRPPKYLIWMKNAPQFDELQRIIATDYTRIQDYPELVLYRYIRSYD